MGADVELPKRGNEPATIRKIFLDPTASHLLISTFSGENYYLHSRASKPKTLSRLRNIQIESVAWSPALPSTSTREILIGTKDGLVYEAFIEASDEFLRRDERYARQVYAVPDGAPVTGLHVDMLPGKGELRRVVVTTPTQILHFVGKVARQGHSDSSPIFSKFFTEEAPRAQVFNAGTNFSEFVISPEATDDYDSERTYAWLTGAGVYHGKLQVAGASADLGHQFYAESKLFPTNLLPEDAGAIRSILLSHFHLMVLCGNTVYIINRYDNRIVFQEQIPESQENILGLCGDLKKSTYWVFTTDSIFEVVATDEDRDIWKIMLADQNFASAARFAKTPAQKDAVAVAHGDYLAAKGQRVEAAGIWGKSSKSFEEVALAFLDENDSDALRRYILTKLASIKKSSIMQRMIAAAWLVEIFMAKLNALDDTISAKALLNGGGGELQLEEQLRKVKKEYQDFIGRYKGDLDRKTVYEIISSHGREEELLYYANSINDYNYVLSYWIQRKNWKEALNVLQKQHDPEIFYKCSSVLLANAPVETVNILLRQQNLNPRNLVPALLNYNKDATVPLSQNQAVRYLTYIINEFNNSDTAVHNTLISIYASHHSRDETALLQYLQQHAQYPHYDADFALRLCIQHGHVQSSVHIYSSMGQYPEAVNMALEHGNVELASIVANRPEDDPALRKKLWLSVARRVISQSDGIKTAIEFLKQCELLKIEDLIPFFPDFVVIDDFKDEICTALEDYSHSIDTLKREMDASTQTASTIRAEIAALDKRFSIIEPGERCYSCRYPLLSRQFFVFPCQHAFHSDCLTNRILKSAGGGKAGRIRALQREIGGSLREGRARERAVEELDGLIAAAW